MAIRNPSGTPYKLSGSIVQYDPSSQEHCLFDLWDQEIIQMGGSPIEYYEVFIQDSTIDPIYLEDRGKLFSPIPICLWALYEPIPSQNLMSAFGIDSPDQMIFDLNYKAVLDAVGHPPKIGSRIFTPHLRENWVIVQRATGEYKLWGVMRLKLICQRFQESETTGEGKVTMNKPNLPEFKII